MPFFYFKLFTFNSGKSKVGGRSPTIMPFYYFKLFTLTGGQ